MTWRFESSQPHNPAEGGSRLRGLSHTSGTVTLLSGCMFSGKTTELLRRVAAFAPQRVLAVKHLIDMRYGAEQIVSHAGKACAAHRLSEPWAILDLVAGNTALVAIDEAHFFDTSLVEVVLHLKQHGVDTVLTCLHPDSWGRAFAVHDRLVAVADESAVLSAQCARCGAPANRTQRITAIVDGNLVGGPESFEPRCLACWHPPNQAPPAGP